MTDNFPVIGIDPGLKGGIAWIDKEGAAHVQAMPLKGRMVDAASLSQLIEAIAPKRIVIERQWVMHKAGQKEGPTGAFTMGVNYGILLGICHAYPTFTPRPQDWKQLLSGTKKDKAAAIEFCQREYPEVSLLRTPRCKSPSDGLADALCITTFGVRATKRK